ncbi:hypothetical protein BYT27DRAFT_7210514 [Phlegmacium glaucopus]|nr:hypothetical protein BYT27DRAFT_7210514 [Phlegmacium glaucopus]
MSGLMMVDCGCVVSVGAAAMGLYLGLAMPKFSSKLAQELRTERTKLMVQVQFSSVQGFWTVGPVLSSQISNILRTRHWALFRESEFEHLPLSNQQHQHSTSTTPTTTPELFLSTTTVAMSHPISPRHDDKHYPLEVSFLRGVISNIMGQACPPAPPSWKMHDDEQMVLNEHRVQQMNNNSK